jgi:branched-chain amino acid aminotransferase
MPAVASIDGALAPLATAAVPVTDRGLRFGDQVFEVARACGPRVVDRAAHLARLATSAAACRLPPPPAALDGWLDAALAAAAEPDATVRVLWTAGDGPGLARDGGPGRAIVIVEPWQPGPPRALRLHTLAVDRSGRTGALVPAAAKTGSYLASVLALAAAHDAGADDALLVDDRGHVLETATGNLAIVEGDAVVFAAGANLPGVTAARVAQLLTAAGVAVSTAVIPRARLDAADEVLVTSSRRGVAAVAAIDGVVKRPGRILTRAFDRYAAWIDSGADERSGPPLAL